MAQVMVRYKVKPDRAVVHLATHDGDDNPLAQVEAFQRFQEHVRDRCDEPPVVSRMREVGSYRP
jgi:hypothetical protein